MFYDAIQGWNIKGMSEDTLLATNDTDIIYYSKYIATSAQPDESLIRDMADAGFSAVINLGLAGQDYSLENEAEIVQHAGMEYIHIPVQWRAPACGPLHRFYGVMREHAGEKLFIHCTENKRVAVFMFLYRVVVLGENCDLAWNDMVQIWQPNEVWRDFICQELEDNDINFKLPDA